MLLPAQSAGGDFTITAAVVSSPAVEPSSTSPSSSSSSSSSSSAATLERVTFGDVCYCAEQSNMALTMHCTFDDANFTAAAAGGEYSDIRLLQFDVTDLKYEADAPVWATTWGGLWWSWENSTNTALSARHEAGYWRNLTHTASWPEPPTAPAERARRRAAPHGHLHRGATDDDAETNLFHSFP